MGIEAVIVFLVLGGCIGLLALTRIAPDAVLAAALTALLVVPYPAGEGWQVGILSAADALAGFGNPGLVTVGVLFIVVTGLRETGAVDWIAHHVLGSPRSVRGAMVRLTAPVAGMSVFLNNTPIVAMMVPAVEDWCKRLKIRPSKLMIPLSYAAILGGVCSLIGTSTNLVVSGLVIAHTDLEPIEMFDITWVGVPVAVTGLLFLVFVGPRLLPDRGSAVQAMSDPREYTVEMEVIPGGPVAGKTIAEAGLRNLPSLFLAEIERAGEVVGVVGPDQRIMDGDRLVFTGIVDSVRDLQNIRGLRPATNQVFKLDSPRYRRRLFEAVVSQTSPAQGRTVREAGFRTLYSAVVVAVARNGERVRGKIGDIRLRTGDTLLVEADEGFDERMRDSRDFLLVRSLDDSTPRRHTRAPIAIAILAAMVLAAALGILSMVAAAMLAAGLMVLTRCCTISEGRRSVEWSVLVVIGASLGLGLAVQQSGAAEAIVRPIMTFAGGDPWLVLAGIYAATAVLSSIITHNAAAALMFPFAMAASATLGVNPMAFIMSLMVAASCGFATPLGYQTNLMVYGPGGYTFTDFARLGIPLTILAGAVTVALAPLIWPF